MILKFYNTNDIKNFKINLKTIKSKILSILLQVRLLFPSKTKPIKFLFTRQNQGVEPRYSGIDPNIEPKDCCKTNSVFNGCGGGTRTHDLQLMRLTS